MLWLFFEILAFLEYAGITPYKKCWYMLDMRQRHNPKY